MAHEIWEIEEREPTERELLFAESRKRFDKDLKRIDDMILTVLKAQIVVERSMELVRRIEHMMLTIVKTQVIIEGFMIGLLEAHGRDPQRFFYTGKKIEELRDKIDPPEVGL